MASRRVATWILAVLILGVAFVAVNAYTTRSEFCGSCHSAMGEYMRTWSASSHHDLAQCLECHSDPGWVGYYHSKVEGAKNALSFFFGVRKTEKSPPPGPAACLREGCHTNAELAAQTSHAPFAHVTHMKSLQCVDCHPGVGHEPAATDHPRACTECHTSDPSAEG
jgi:cytochrome c nitrite reductase small subunit